MGIVDVFVRDLLIIMRIHTFAFGIGLSAMLAVSWPSGEAVAQTITDQYGTEILTEVLPPVTRRKVQQTQSVLHSGGGVAPIAVDKRGRFHLGGGSQKDNLLVNQMLGVVLLPTPSDVRPNGWPGVEGIWHDFEEFPKEVGFTLQDYIGRPVSLSSLDQMVKDVIVAYREGDRPVVDVLLPEQDITSGVVQLVVVESKLNRIRVEGVDVDTEEYIRSQMRVRKGEVVRTSDVLRDLSWVNKKPYRKVDLTYDSDPIFGTTDIVIKNYEERANWFYSGYEDSGTAFLGRDRLIVGFNLGDVFGPDRSLSYQFSSDFDFEHIRANTLVYTQDLPWRHSFTLLASFVSIESSLPLPFLAFPNVTNGENVQLSARYTVPLQSTENKTRQLDFGFDWKSIESNLEYIGSSPVNLLAANNRNPYEVYQFSVGYSETIQHRRAVTEFNIRGVWSPGDFSNQNTALVFAGNRPGSSSDYFYGTAGIEHNQELYKDWALRFKMEGQVASENLQASELFGAGGFDTVRGFEQRELVGDQGFWGTIELYTPDLALSRIFDWENESDELRFLGFFDAASVEQSSVVPAAPFGLINQRQIGSVGVGLRWSYSDWFKLRADYGYPVYTDTNRVGLNESGRFHIGATATF